MPWATDCRMKDSLSDKRRLITALSVLAIVLVWECASLLAGSEQLLPGPWRTLKSTAALFCDLSFLKVVGSTVLRAVAGFAIAAAAGLLLGIAGGLDSRFHAFLKPWVVVIRSTPVVAFVLLAVIWLSPGAVPVTIGTLVMFPIIYLNTVEGIGSVDGKTVEMARFYGIRGARLTREVYLPSIRPFLMSGVSNAVGIGWRAVVVGEVLSQPQWGIGTVMRSAQTFLQVDILIAWTLVTVVIGAVFDKIIRYGYRSR